MSLAGIFAEVINAFLDPTEAQQKAARRRRRLIAQIEDLLNDAAEEYRRQQLCIRTADGRRFQFTDEVREIRAGDFHFCHGELRYSATVAPNVHHVCHILREIREGEAPPRPAPARAPGFEKKIEAALRTLGVNKEADAAAIRSSFRELAKKFHPDLHPGNQKIADRMRRIVDAYNFLKHAGRV